MSKVVVVTAGEDPSPEDKLMADKVKRALDRFDTIKEFSSEDRKSRLSDLKFRGGDQWPDDIIQERVNDSRPALVINRLPQFIRLVTNEMRQNRPAMTVSPVDGDGTVDVAKVLQGMFRHIEYDSNAEYAYDTAADAQCTSGLGFFRVVTQFEDPKSFDQIIKIKRIRNAFSVYTDPAAQEPDYSDAKYMFITEDMKKDEYKAAYPESKLARATSWEGDGDPVPGWITKEGCRVAEYFCIETAKTKIWLMDDRSVYEDKELEKDKDGKPKAPQGRTIMGSRDTELPTVKWMKMNCNEVLEETEWLGKWIPIIPVMGDELEIDGKISYEGIVRYARDPQRMYNYWASAETETIALAPRSPWLGVEGQFEGHEDKWRVANRKNLAYLEYRNVSINGVAAPPPQRNVQEPPIRAITQARELASEDMKATTGTYDPALGKAGNETSGRAILERKVQHTTSNYHYSDNMGRSIRHVARIVLDLIPKVYDSERVVRIVNPDDTTDLVTINSEHTGKDGVKRIYDIRKGKYDVVVSAGPSYATKRQEAVNTMLDLVTADPQILGAIGDLLVGNMDWEGAPEIAARLKKLLPPALQDNSNISPAAQQQINSMQKMIKQLTTALNATTLKLETKVMDVQSKERIALNKNLTDLIMTNEQMFHDKSTTGFQTMVQHIDNQLDRVGEGQNPDAAARAGTAQLDPQLAGASNPPGQDGTQPLPQQPQ